MTEIQTKHDVDNTTDHRDIDELVSAVTRVGAAWARYGLGVARMSIEASATSLEATASALGAVSKRLEKLNEEDQA